MPFYNRYCKSGSLWSLRDGFNKAMKYVSLIFLFKIVREY